MSKQARRDEDALVVDSPDAFLRRERIAQRAGVVLLTLFVVAGLVGMFGNGPLADATITSGAATIRFDRFTRQTFRTELEISVTGAHTPAVNVTLSRAFLDAIDLLEVRPSDALKHLDDDVATFTVPANNGSATLSLHYDPKQYGVLEADLVASGHPPVRIRQLVFF